MSAVKIGSIFIIKSIMLPLKPGPCFCRNTQLHKRTLACNGEETPPPLEAIIVIPEGRRDIIPAELSEVGGQNKRFLPVK